MLDVFVSIRWTVRADACIEEWLCMCLSLFSGVIEVVSNVFVEVSGMYLEKEMHSGLKSCSSLLLCLLDIIHCLLKNLSSVVRLALQVTFSLYFSIDVLSWQVIKLGTWSALVEFFIVNTLFTLFIPQHGRDWCLSTQVGMHTLCSVFNLTGF